MPLGVIGPCFQIGFSLADKYGRHEISVKFDYGQNQIVKLGVTCPCYFCIRVYGNFKDVYLQSYLMCSITGQRETLLKVLCDLLPDNS